MAREVGSRYDNSSVTYRDYSAATGPVAAAERVSSSYPNSTFISFFVLCDEPVAGCVTRTTDTFASAAGFVLPLTGFPVTFMPFPVASGKEKGPSAGSHDHSNCCRVCFVEVAVSSESQRLTFLNRVLAIFSCEQLIGSSFGDRHPNGLAISMGFRSLYPKYVALTTKGPDFAAATSGPIVSVVLSPLVESIVAARRLHVLDRPVYVLGFDLAQ